MSTTRIQGNQSSASKRKSATRGTLSAYIRLYRAHEKLVALLPGKERDQWLAIFYCSIGLAITVLDCEARGVSLRSLYVVPVILASLTGNHICAACVSIFMAMAHVISLRIALIPSDEGFSLLWNFLPTLMSYLFLMETVRLLTRAMLDVLAYNDVLLERVVLLEIENDRKAHDDTGFLEESAH